MMACRYELGLNEHLPARSHQCTELAPEEEQQQGCRRADNQSQPHAVDARFDATAFMTCTHKCGNLRGRVVREEYAQADRGQQDGGTDGQTGERCVADVPDHGGVYEDECGFRDQLAECGYRQGQNRMPGLAFVAHCVLLPRWCVNCLSCALLRVQAISTLNSGKTMFRALRKGLSDCEGYHASDVGERRVNDSVTAKLIAHESGFGNRTNVHEGLSPSYAQSYTHRVDNSGDYPPEHAYDVDNLFFLSTRGVDSPCRQLTRGERRI
jgi:hypothetical protein